ncbi:PAP2 family protein, partial [Bacillaceae bacterium HSR45]|nr:PAP2 family protein [Bacillaceae bacterium HSR45]
MKNRRTTTGMFTIPLFIISIMIFILMTVGVIQDVPFLKFVDSHSLDWFTTTFGTPQRQFEGDMLNYYMTFCATIGDVSGVIVMSVIITIVLLFKYPRLAIWFICTILSGTLINILIKMTIERMRPYNHLPIDSGFSFPSGHSNASTLFFVT